MPIRTLQVSSVTSLSVLAGVAVGCTCLATWVVWKYVNSKEKSHTKRPAYVLGKSIYIVNTAEEWEEACLELKKDITVIKVLGLDCEWVHKQKVALLQLAAPSGLCVLVRLFKLRPIFPESLRQLLADKSILKVGVAVGDDGKRLRQDYGLSVSGCVDLRHVLKRVRGVFHCRSRGLRGLAVGVLGVDISKNVDVRCGNWEAETYSPQQIAYAATDAAVGADIFLQLVHAKIVLAASQCVASSSGNLVHASKHSHTWNHDRPCTSHDDTLSQPSAGDLETDPCSSEKLIPCQATSNVIPEKNTSRDSSHHGMSNLDPRDFRGETKEDADSELLSSGKSSDCKKDKTIAERVAQSKKYEELNHEEREQIWKVARSMCQGIVDFGYVYLAKGGGLPSVPGKQGDSDKSTKAYSTRKRPLWDNCRLEAPDGSVLCTCDVRKAQWYLDKELGDKVCDEPLTVRLRFEPASRPESERNYYLQEKENVCVVCGCDQDYVRKFIIPFEYRKFFPSALKDHSSHDVLLLCTPCHRKSCDFDAVLRSQLAVECNAPLNSGTTAKTVTDHQLQRVRSAGRALTKNRSSMPADRVTELEHVIQDFYGVEGLTDELIEQASIVEAKQTSDGYVPHGKLVVRHVARNGGLLAFQARWRQHFLDTMNPQHLPTYWSVDFVPEAWNQRT